jgi:hypothetical protein
VLKVSCSLVLWLSWAEAAFAGSQTQSVAPSVRVDGLNTDLIVQIVESSRVVPPGGMATLKYVLYSTEGVPGRIRLQVHAPPGWNVIDVERVQREWVLDAWDIVTQELRVAAPPDALTGRNELIRLTAEMVDVPGVSEALAHVQVLSGAGVRSGGAHLAMTTMVGVARLDPSGSEQAHMGSNVDLSGQVGARTNIALTYRQGSQESVSNYRYYQPEKYLSGSILHHAWNVQFGGRVISTGNVITGPSVTGDGITVQRLKGRVLMEIALARPTIFSGDGAGHLWRGSLGLKTARGTIGVVVSDFSRPTGYSTLPPIADPTLDPDSLEDIERERALSSGRTSTRVQGVGLEANLQLARTHRLRLRGGTVRLESAEQDKMTAPAFEAQYSFSGPSATLNARVRETPPSVQGIYLPGDERSADGTLRLIGELRAVGRAYWYENVTLGQSYRAGTEGRSLGLRYTRRRWRLEANGNLRDAYSSTQSHRRTGLLSFGMPLGPISVNASTELGEEKIPRGVYPYRSYRGDLRWSGEPGFVSFTFGSYASGGIRPRQQADLLTSLVYGAFEVAGGAWITQGWTGGGAPGVWTNIGLPVTSGFTLFLGIEHGPQLLAPNGSPWRFSVAMRRKLVVPLPFLRNGAVAQEHAQGPP